MLPITTLSVSKVVREGRREDTTLVDSSRRLCKTNKRFLLSLQSSQKLYCRYNFSSSKLVFPAKVVSFLTHFHLPFSVLYGNVAIYRLFRGFEESVGDGGGQGGKRVERVQGEGLHKALDKVNSHASDILVFSVQWKDLNEYLESVKGKLKERFRELDSKEVDLKDQSFGLEERARVVEEAEAKLGDLEVESDGFRMEVSLLGDLSRGV
ncbi:hypothetical protein Rs2_42714 [Raphanus sativus]|nr:hypothetical protein Rs2_42714 [Raphanus sativus]